MIKITKEELLELKNKSIDDFNAIGGNFWIIHAEDNKFYAVKHGAGQYWISTGTKYFTDVIFVLLQFEYVEFKKIDFRGLANDKVWR